MIYRTLVVDPNKRACSEDLIKRLNKVIYKDRYKQISLLEDGKFGECIYLVEDIQSKKRFILSKKS